jgi:hypothetical protein
MNKSYLFKVWGMSIVTAPLIFAIATLIITVKNAESFSDFLGFILISIGYGIILSIPAFLICYFSFIKLYKTIKSSVKLKIILIMIGVISMLLTFYLLYGSQGYNPKQNFAGITFSIGYGICIIFFGLIFKINRPYLQKEN